MPVLGHGVKFWEHFQAADTQAFLLQPGGQSQRREFLLGQRSQVDFLPLTKTGKEIRRRAVQSRAGRLGQFFWRLDSIAPPLEYCGWHGSWHPRICRSHSGPRTGNLRPGPVRPGIRRFLRTYQNSVSDDLISFLLQGTAGQEESRGHSHPCPRPVPAGFFLLLDPNGAVLPGSAPGWRTGGHPVHGPYRPSCIRCLSAAPLGWNSRCARLPAAGVMSEKKKG